MTNNQLRLAFLSKHRKYERIAFRIFHKAFKRAAKEIPWSRIPENGYEDFIKTHFNKTIIDKAYTKVYTTIGLEHGEWIGRQINKEAKNFTTTSFTRLFRRNLSNWLMLNAGRRITSVQDTFINHIIQILQNGIDEGKTIRETAKEIQSLLGSRGFYRWQSMRIARTESTSAANYSAIQSGNSSGLVLDKVWISSNDTRTRRIPEDRFDHIQMNQVKVPENELFNVQGDMLEFPGDPRGQGSNIINCRCSVSLVPRRDSNGLLIRRNI